MAQQKKRPKPNTPPADTPSEALANVRALLLARSSGWDRQVVRDIIKVVYGNTEEFCLHHITLLEKRVGP